MEFARLLLEYMNALMYPVLAFSVVYLFRSKILSIFDRKITAKYKGIEVEVGRKNEIIRSIQDNYRIVARQLEDDLSILRANGVVENEHTKNLQISLKTLELNLDQHVVLDFILKNRGASSVSALEKAIDKLGMKLNADQLEKERSRAMTAISELQHKGVVIRTNEELIRVNSLFMKLESNND